MPTGSLDVAFASIADRQKMDDTLEALGRHYKGTAVQLTSMVDPYQRSTEHVVTFADGDRVVLSPETLNAILQESGSVRDTARLEWHLGLHVMNTRNIEVQHAVRRVTDERPTPMEVQHDLRRVYAEQDRMADMKAAKIKVEAENEKVMGDRAVQKVRDAENKARYAALRKEEAATKKLVKDLMDAATLAEPLTAKYENFDWFLRSLVQYKPQAWMRWGEGELEGLRTFPTLHNEIVRAYAALEPMKLAERCRMASGRQRGWLSKLITPDEAAYYETQMRPLLSELQSLLVKMEPIFTRFEPQHQRLAAATLALQVLANTTEDDHARSIAHHRLRVLLLARTSNAMLQQDLLNTQQMIASAAASVSELLDVTIPNWGRNVTAELSTQMMAQTADLVGALKPPPPWSRGRWSSGGRTTTEHPATGAGKSIVDVMSTSKDMFTVIEERLNSVENRVPQGW